MKRFLDAVMAGLSLILLLPLFALTALAVRLSLGSPVLFRQQRPGREGRPFVMYKFRTMREAVDRSGHALSDAERLTRFGSFLRSTSIDELPTLWNVLKGDMALVGPRPLLMEYLEHYTPEQAKRHDVRPGITGWAQVNGRNATTWDERLAMDVWYVENRSFVLDLRILLRTFGKVYTREGISQPGHATMERFRGTAG